MWQQLAAANTGKQDAVCVAVGHRRMIERLTQLVDRDVANNRYVRIGGANRRVFGKAANHLAAVPGVADDAAHGVAFTFEHSERLKELPLIKHQPLIINTGIHHFHDPSAQSEYRVAYGIDQSLTGRHTARDALARPYQIGNVEDGTNTVGRCALPSFRSWASQHRVQVGKMLCSFDQIVWLPSDRVTKADEIVQ